MVYQDEFKVQKTYEVFSNKLFANVDLDDRRKGREWGKGREKESKVREKRIGVVKLELLSRGGHLKRCMHVYSSWFAS